MARLSVVTPVNIIFLRNETGHKIGQVMNSLSNEVLPRNGYFIISRHEALEWMSYHDDLSVGAETFQSFVHGHLPQLVETFPGMLETFRVIGVLDFLCAVIHLVEVVLCISTTCFVYPAIYDLSFVVYVKADERRVFINVGFCVGKM